jgi:hypothetical protein
VAAAGNRGGLESLAQGAAFQRGQRRLAAGVEETDDVLSWWLSLAAASVAAISLAERPASSARVSTTIAEAFVSLSTFWLKAVCNVASSEFKPLSFALSASESRAPARTKSL